MTDTFPSVVTTLRIPGDWAHPGALIERMPEGYRLTGELLVLPDGTEIEFVPMPPDGQFAEVFASSCRQPATDEELAVVGRYSVNIGLNGPGGSLDAARTMLEAGAAIVKAGGAGVFIDNSALAHGGELWLEMAEDGSPDAVSYAFVSMMRSERELKTIGMHVLGYPDLIIRHEDLEADADTLVEVIRDVSSGEKPLDDGHLICDEHGPRFQAKSAPPDDWPIESSVHNPFGRLKLVSIKDVAEEN
ncbi:MAG: hypothetical protein KDA86_04495 [Planctomycetaceae bacterium]|nr:hypothetical protein [Planctomycetaceae bacterium]